MKKIEKKIKDVQDAINTRASKGKKGIYYTIDALLASLLLIGSILLIMNTPGYNQNSEQKTYISQDLLATLSEIKIKEINNSFIREEIANGNITDINKSALEQIGDYWAINETDKARQLLDSLITSAIPSEVGIKFALEDEELLLRNITTKNDVTAYSRMISGIDKGKPILGSSASAYLKKIRNKKTASYGYFGGFVGQGNITIKIDDIPSDVSSTDIARILLEAEIGTNFSIYINNNYCDSIGPSNTNMSPDVWDLTHCNSSIEPNTNNVTLAYTGAINDAHVSGGYVRIDYRTDELQQNITISEKTYNFPEIKGVVNLYDSFYVPGELTEMELYLNYLADHSEEAFNNTFYLTIGNDTIFVDTDSVTQQTITISDATLSSILNYSALNRKTVPIRMGFENLSYAAQFLGNSEIMLVTDVSGSMDWKMVGADYDTGTRANCDDAAINDTDAQRLSVAKCLDNEFASDVLNITGNKLGLVSYSTSTDTADTVLPTTNITLIRNTIGTAVPQTGYTPDSSTCICCGINSARSALTTGHVATTIISSASSWKYETNSFIAPPDNDSSGDAWYQPNFDDSSWSSANAVLGHDAGGGGVAVATDLGEATGLGHAEYVDLWERGTDTAGPPNDFSSGIINSTANTFGVSSANDGWDSQGGTYGYDTDVDFNGATGGHLNMDFRTGGSNNNACNNRDCSGAYGISVNITTSMYQKIQQNGTAMLSFDYEWAANSANPFESSDQFWIKAKFIQPNGTERWLGNDLDSGDSGSDSDLEIWTADNPDQDYSGRTLIDLTEYITGAGMYYFHVGGKIRADSSDEWGNVYFDNLQIRITNHTDSYYFRKSFNLANTSIVQRALINILEDDYTKIYLNGNLVTSGTTNNNGTYWDRRGIFVDGRYFTTGTNVIAVELLNSAGNAKFDLEMIGVNKPQPGAILVMTDGQANVECATQGTTGDLDLDGTADTGSDDAIQAACDARENWGIQVFSVGFSASSDEPTLIGIANCGEGIYAKSNNISELSDFYNQVVLNIISATVKSQTIIISGGNLSSSNLYGNSYLRYKYTPVIEPPEASKISLELQTAQFNSCSPNVEIPEGITIVDSKITSYSSEHWTKLLQVNSNTVFNLTEYNNNFVTLGDPYIIHIPPEYLVTGNNQIFVDTGDEPYNSTGCSMNNSLIYTALINSSTARTNALETAIGCKWTIQTASGKLINATIPKTFTGANLCYYTNSSHSLSDHNPSDAYDSAVYNLLRQLDYDDDGTIFVDIDENDLEIIIITTGKIPFMWGPSMLRAEVWQ